MDFTIVGSVLVVLLAFIPALTTFLSRANRTTRTENRKYRLLLQEHDRHLFHLEREGWTKKGLRPPVRPELLREAGDGGERDADAIAPAGRDGEAEPPPGAGPRHASGEG